MVCDAVLQLCACVTLQHRFRVKGAAVANDSCHVAVAFPHSDNTDFVQYDGYKQGVVQSHVLRDVGAWCARATLRSAVSRAHCPY